MKFTEKIYVAGHRGMAGSAIIRKLKEGGYENIVVVGSDKLDLRNQQDTADFFSIERPDYVFLAAAKVGGIVANNTYRAQFIYDNLAIETNVIQSSRQNEVKKLLFLGSSCIYPKLAPQPIREEYLLTGMLEPTNEFYAIAKIAGIKLCQAYRDQYGSDFISVMPTNLYGIGDNYHAENSHVLPALIRKFHEAKEQKKETVTIWGSGNPYREFLYADDLAEACLFLMNNYSGREPVNTGTGKDLSISALAGIIKKITGFEGSVLYDTSKPDGTPKKLLDVSKIHTMGWKHRTELEEGIRLSYADFLSRQSSLSYS
jgi:GDP-L-fucose synthase